MIWHNLTQVEDERLWRWRARGATWAVIEARILRERKRQAGVGRRWALVARAALRMG